MRTFHGWVARWGAGISKLCALQFESVMVRDMMDSLRRATYKHLSLESNQVWADPPQISMFLWVLGRMMDACLVQTVPYGNPRWWSAIKP